jgi:hypothetical protein
LSCTAIVLSCVLLAGSSSSGLLVGICLVSFSTAAPPDGTQPITPASDVTAAFSQLDIRVGYFSLCGRINGAANWVCGEELAGRVLLLSDHPRVYKTAVDYRTSVISPAPKYKQPLMIPP